MTKLLAGQKLDAMVEGAVVTFTILFYFVYSSRRRRAPQSSIQLLAWPLKLYLCRVRSGISGQNSIVLTFMFALKPDAMVSESVLESRSKRGVVLDKVPDILVDDGSKPFESVVNILAYQDPMHSYYPVTAMPRVRGNE